MMIARTLSNEREVCQSGGFPISINLEVQKIHGFISVTKERNSQIIRTQCL
jgi:hypothetical protein